MLKSLLDPKAPTIISTSVQTPTSAAEYENWNKLLEGGATTKPNSALSDPPCLDHLNVLVFRTVRRGGESKWLKQPALLYSKKEVNSLYLGAICLRQLKGNGGRHSVKQWVPPCLLVSKPHPVLLQSSTASEIKMEIRAYLLSDSAINKNTGDASERHHFVLPLKEPLNYIDPSIAALGCGFTGFTGTWWSRGATWHTTTKTLEAFIRRS